MCLTKKKLADRVDAHMRSEDGGKGVLMRKGAIREATQRLLYREIRRTAAEIRAVALQCPDPHSAAAMVDFIDSRYHMYGEPRRPLAIEVV